MAHCYDDYEDQIECEFRYGPLVKGVGMIKNNNSINDAFVAFNSKADSS